MPEEILRKLFVGREKLLESLVKEIENAARKKTPRFYLIVGPRGTGKSHFLVLLYYEIKNKLGSLLIPIKLAEEEYSVNRALFYEMITRGELENIEKAFFKIIDEHTPYYQEIFQLLTGQKRRIFDIVILSGAPVTPKQIADEARMDLPTVTTQLRRLETDGYVISRPKGRHTTYEVRERLFRLWREMRQPFGRKRVSILLEFMQHWYTPEERKELFRAKFELLEAGERKALKDLCILAEVVPPEFKAEALLKLTPKLIEFGEYEEAAYEIEKLKETATRIRDRELEAKIPLYEGSLMISEKKYEEALEAFNKAIEINPKSDFALSRKGAALGILGRYEEALGAFNKAIEINPKNESAIRNRTVALLELKRYAEALEAAKRIKDTAPSEYSKIDASLIIIKACISLNRETVAILELEKIKNRITEQNPYLIENFIGICLNLALNELKAGNYGNVTRLMEMAFNSSQKLQKDRITSLTMNFLKEVADSGEIRVIKVAVDEVIKLRGDEYQEHIRPIIKAIEIIETRDVQKFYSLQIEEREIVADIVRKITKSDELLPEELKRKESN